MRLGFFQKNGNLQNNSMYKNEISLNPKQLRFNM